ncbi:MAG: dihydroorotase [Candidatus Limnocylindrales bacterium]
MNDRFDLIVRNATLVTSSGRRVVDICSLGERFAAIAEPGELTSPAALEIDASGLFAMPGVIDAHVHFREPGLEHKENWLTGTRAAVMGGVTTVLDMPNTLPATDTVDRARDKLALAVAGSYCDFGLFGLAGEDLLAARQLLESRLVVGMKVFLGPTTGGLSAPSDGGLRLLLDSARDQGVRVGFHAEDREIIRDAEALLHGAGRTDARAHLEARPVVAETQAIARIGELLRATGAMGHIHHLSSAEGLAVADTLRAADVDLTTEATPHHCLLGIGAYSQFGGIARVNPPIRGEPHAAALRAGLADGRIDVIASDHAPHTPEEKSGADIWTVPSGFAGVETSLRLFLTDVNEGLLTLERLVYLTSEGPAKTWGLWPRKGSVEVGADADLTLVELDHVSVIRAADLHGKHNVTPFEGRTTHGRAVATIVRGRIVMRDAELIGEPGVGRPWSLRTDVLSPRERTRRG